jgi:colicin import membrane protein
MAEIVYATIEDDTETVPPDLRCIWPGCTRRRAPERAGGSGRQKEYCLKADRPENGGGPVHNARNRWAWRRGADSDLIDVPAETAAVNGAETPAAVRDMWPVSAAKNRASELLEQARRQHAVALASLQSERELYQQLGEQLTVMSDPASLDLEITAIGLKAGRDVSQAGEEAARARRAQLQAERDRDQAIRLKEDADAAAEQFAADTELAERTLAERTSEFERERGLLLRRVGEAEDRADRVAAEAEAAKTAARAAVAAATERADVQIERARQRAAEQVAAARADAERAQAESERARAAADQASADAERARGDAERARADAERARGDAETLREALRQARDDAQARVAAAETSAAAANARATVIGAEIERLRTERAEELARLETAHRAALDAERARAKRAEDDLDALRADPGR